MVTIEQLAARLGVGRDARQASASGAFFAGIIADAGSYILAYTRRSPVQWLPVFDGVQLRLAVYLHGRAGQEGMASRSEGGLSTGWPDDLPAELRRALDPYRRIGGFGHDAAQS